MSDPLARISTRATHQRDPVTGMVPNSEGGYVFPVDDLTRFRRFLILGTEGGTYYIAERDLTKQNVGVLERLVAAGRGMEALDVLVEISTAGRAAKQNPTIFSLAYLAGCSDPLVRREALHRLPEVCRIGTHLFMFAGYVEQFRGWGRSLRTAVANWYLSKEPRHLAEQVAKYRAREGWSHRDLLRLAKPRPERFGEVDQILGWVTGRINWSGDLAGGDAAKFLSAVDRASTSDSVAEVAELIREHRLPREVIASELLKDPKIWNALLPHMGMTALVRNLGVMTANGTLKPLTPGIAHVVDQLTNDEAIARSRIHPLQVLLGQRTYMQGHGFKGQLRWTPIHELVDALEKTYEASFGNVEPAGKRTLLALDVSGSMSAPIMGTPLSAAQGSAALAMITLRTEPMVHCVAFADGRNRSMHSYMGYGCEMKPLHLTRRMSLPQILDATRQVNFGGTDCAQPMLHALEAGLEVDTFVIYTDSETWAGDIKPHEALRRYRERTGIGARLVVVAMTSNGFTIADPADAGMLDVVGFDANLPNLINDFSAGRV